MSALEQCAACGKGGVAGLVACAECDLVKYCGDLCREKHRPEHVKRCEERADELFDEKLFKPPPPRDDCPICMIRMPCNETLYNECCGQTLCSGCVVAIYKGNVGANCPYCRTPMAKTDDEVIERINKRIQAGDADAIDLLGSSYYSGDLGLPKDLKNAFELWMRAAELGSADANGRLADHYRSGGCVAKDLSKEWYHTQQAAMKGDRVARYNLGVAAEENGNFDRAIKHWIIAAGSGCENSLTCTRRLFSNAHATKAQYERALREYQQYQMEVRSVQRDRASEAKRASQERNAKRATK